VPGPAAIVVAAGRGERLGSDGPKALVPVHGRPMLAWSVDALRAAGVGEVVVVLPEGAAAPSGCVGAPGGAERSHSVRNGLAALRPGPPDQAVLVHDAARPLLTPELVVACLDALAADPPADAAIAAAALTDTVKEAEPGTDVVVGTLDRSRLWGVQTPQVFRRDVLERVMALDDATLASATDDASLVERAGGTVRLVPAPRWNLKVTVPEDLALAALLLRDRR
jgi:2-C-methyl-D-erythritol 4-phosphate cytidylyltransferase